MENSLSQRIEYLDTFKGIAILLLVAFHINGQVFHSYPQWFRTSSYQGVHAFFLASGLGLTYSLINKGKLELTVRFWSSWFKRRFLRLIPLYWLVLFLTAFIFKFHLNILKVSSNISSPLIDIILHAFMLHVFIDKTFFSLNAAWWFVGVISFFYLFFPVVFSILYRFRTSVFVFVLVPVSALILFFILPLSRQVAVSMLFFTAGICLAFLIRKIRDLRLTPSLYTQSLLLGLSFLFSLIGVFVTAYSLLHPSVFFSLPSDLDYVLFSSFFVTAIYALSMAVILFNKYLIVSRLEKFLAWFGVYSYAVFLIHWGLIGPVFSAFKSPLTGGLVYFIILTALSLTLTRLSDFGLSRFRRTT